MINIHSIQNSIHTGKIIDNNIGVCAVMCTDDKLVSKQDVNTTFPEITLHLTVLLHNLFYHLLQLFKSEVCDA
uniref:Uncharacterized protein n=1 Tax=Pararge aegeria TaxID=116150 RepID=S4P4H8_9NEOP